MQIRSIRKPVILTALVCALSMLPLPSYGMMLDYLPASSASAAAVFNHPVLVEGNCDSPVPGTTIVNLGTCGDYDGDGRIGTAEDTDGADRIFGTLNAALGPGTGAAAGTGANWNGRITIVKSGRFSEIAADTPGEGNGLFIFAPLLNPGQVTIEAAPGVDAVIDAVLQGDPAGGNTLRQASSGIIVNAPLSNPVVLRNLVIRNWKIGIDLRNGRLTVDNCRIENNRDYGIRATVEGRLAVYNSAITSTGFRVPISGAANPGIGVSFEGSTAGIVAKTLITSSFGAAISNTSVNGTGSVRYYEVILDQNGAGIINAIREVNP